MANICNNEITLDGPEFDVDVLMKEIEKEFKIHYTDRPDEVPTTFVIFSKWVPPLEKLAFISTKAPNVTIEIHYFELGTKIVGNATICNNKIDDDSNTMSDEEYEEHSKFIDIIYKNIT